MEIESEMCVYEWRAGPLSGISLQCSSINSGSSSSSRRYSMDDGGNTMACTRVRLSHITESAEYEYIAHDGDKRKNRNVNSKGNCSFLFRSTIYNMQYIQPIRYTGYFRCECPISFEPEELTNLNVQVLFFLWNEGCFVPFLFSFGSNESSHSFFHG